MNNGPSPHPLGPARGLVLSLGVVLVVAGAGLLLYMGFFVYTIMNRPEDVRVIQFLLQHVRAEDRAIYGTMQTVGTDQVIKYEMNLTQSVRTILFLFLGVGMAAVLANVMNALISGGVKIINIAAPRMRRKAPGAKAVK